MTDIQNAIALFAELVGAAMPFAVVFAVGQRLVTMFFGMAFKGYIDL